MESMTYRELEGFLSILLGSGVGIWLIYKILSLSRARLSANPNITKATDGAVKLDNPGFRSNLGRVWRMKALVVLKTLGAVWVLFGSVLVLWNTVAFGIWLAHRLGIDSLALISAFIGALALEIVCSRLALCFRLTWPFDWRGPWGVFAMGAVPAVAAISASRLLH